MKNFLIFTIMLLYIGTSAQISNLSESINSSSFNLFKQLYSEEENCFYSPYSIFGALSMTYAGSEGKTKEEMAKVLEIKDEKINENFEKLTTTFNSNADIKLLISNSIWLHKTLKLKKSYSKLLNSYYQAKSKNVDFAEEGNREDARKEINDWVENQTNKMIKEFIKPGVLTESTGMVLINAVYFNALWEKEFSAEKTSPDKFLAATGDSVGCEMMNTNFQNNYFEDENFQVIEIPYKNKSASMIIFLPKTGIDSDIKKIDYKYYADIVRSFEYKSIKLSIPKFKMEVSYDLSETMKKMGMKSAFNREADFSGITGNKDLIISNILHQSVIEVSEKGTEASSTTAVISMRSTQITKDIPIVFKADKPFLFVIKENNTNAIIFMGYLAKPMFWSAKNEAPKVKSVD